MHFYILLTMLMKIPKCKKYLISKLFYKKIKLYFEFDTDNFFINQIDINNFPIKTSIKYEIGNVLYKEIIHIKHDDYSEFRLRVFEKIEEEDVTNWNYYMNNGQVYKFKSLSYEYI